MKKNNKIILIVVLCIIFLTLSLISISFIYIKSNFISKDKVKEIIINDTKLNGSDISFKEIELDLDGETKKYEVEFYYNRIEYKYEIDAKSGNIIYSNFNNPNIDSNNNNNNNNSNEFNNNSNNNINSCISSEEAKNIALTDAGFNDSDVIFTDVEIDYYNGKLVYEIDFVNNLLEYEYKIDCTSKVIISKYQEPRD